MASGPNTQNSRHQRLQNVDSGPCSGVLHRPSPSLTLPSAAVCSHASLTGTRVARHCRLVNEAEQSTHTQPLEVQTTPGPTRQMHHEAGSETPAVYVPVIAVACAFITGGGLLIVVAVVTGSKASPHSHPSSPSGVSDTSGMPASWTESNVVQMIPPFVARILFSAALPLLASLLCT